MTHVTFTRAITVEYAQECVLPASVLEHERNASDQPGTLSSVLESRSAVAEAVQHPGCLSALHLAPEVEGIAQMTATHAKFLMDKGRLVVVNPKGDVLTPPRPLLFSINLAMGASALLPPPLEPLVG